MGNHAQNADGKTAPVRAGRAVCILNPNARLMRDPSRRAAVEIALRDREIDLVETTSEPVPQARIAGQAGVDTVIACGGDGTVWQAVNAMDPARQRLAVLPAGRGNCVARELGVVTIDAALAALDKGDMQRLDAMEVTLRQNATRRTARALNAVAFGVLAEVVTAADRLPGLGALAYPVSGLLGMTPARAYHLLCDGAEMAPRRQSGVVVLNTSWLARYRPGPKVRATDGRLDLFLEPGGFLSQKLSEISLVAGFSAIGLETRQIRSCSIRPDRPEGLYLDGEVIPAVSAVDVRVLPGLVLAISGGGE